MFCQSKECIEEATNKVYWPGRPVLSMCDKHCAQAIKVGQAIGCFIVTEPIDIKISE